MKKKRADVINHSSAEDVNASAYPDWLQERLQWFMDMKFGLFIHWGVYCQWNCIESWPLVEADEWGRPDDLECWIERDRDLDRFRRDYWALNRTFNPTEFDPSVWATAAAAAGMKYVTFTTKHHDGFSMFDTAQTDYRVTHPDCPFHNDPRADIAKEVFNTFRQNDFAVSAYFSKSDWHHPAYWDPTRPMPDRHPNYDTHAEPERWAQFVEFAHGQIEELMTGYGKIDVLWLDGGQVRPPDQDLQMAEMAAMARRHQPGLIIADRTVGGPYENILTPEQTVPDKPLGHPWESCMTMGTGWSYRANDTYKPTRQLIYTLVDIVAKGGNLLLNIGPSPAGTFAPDALARLEEIGRWMEVNAEAIHGTREIAPYVEGNVRYTQKEGAAYAIVLAAEGETAPTSTVSLAGLTPPAGAEVSMLGVERPLDWRLTDGRAEVRLPIDNLAGDHAWVLKFPLDH